MSRLYRCKYLRVGFRGPPSGYAAPMVKPLIIAGALVAAPAIGLNGCANGNQSANETTTSTSAETSASLAPGTERLSTQLKSADGTPVPTATLDFANGFPPVTAE